ncbi:hypothetical protein [Persicirhabdus sediminis]|uniref:Uncharacterized protein n=1 Tax=Persicirhabdus sediminis TaxID=454144 RepID=A0A8J7SK90_9BACT|nr:hypothetical protein [Persicirhabdus sediminis]MBK1791894.1 hypothetical protein [Persicirhabdus sediminis]
MNFTIAGKQLTCPHCQSLEFTKSSAQLNTAMASFMGVDWLNRSADTYQCLACGRIEWFLNEGDGSGADTDCLSCGTVMKAEQSKCSNCGWNYQ